MRITILLLSALTCFAAEPVRIWTSNELKSQGAALPTTSKVAGNTLGSWGGHSASLWKRTASGDAELHKTKSDLMIVQEGAATFFYGGTIVNAHPTTAGEIRGASISNGQSRKLGPGDVIHVPPNTPHQFVLEKGQTITYVAVKVGG